MLPVPVLHAMAVKGMGRWHSKTSGGGTVYRKAAGGGTVHRKVAVAAVPQGRCGGGTARPLVVVPHQLLSGASCAASATVSTTPSTAHYVRHSEGTSTCGTGSMILLLHM